MVTGVSVSERYRGIQVLYKAVTSSIKLETDVSISDVCRRLGRLVDIMLLAVWVIKT